MVAQTPPTCFTLDPARVDEFIEDISSFDMCFRDVASKWGTTVGGLALFITSEDGLQTIATAELAAALSIRLTALNLLPSVVEALGYIVMEYAREERSIPPENSLRHIRLLELQRRSAHRAGALTFKLAHFNPKPIKSYTVRPVAPSAQTCGMPKRPLGHGGASDFAPVPPVRRFGATGGLDTAATADSSASPRATDIDGSASTSVQDDQDAPSTSTSDSPGSAIESTGEAALRAAHPRTTSQEARTLKGSSPSQTSDPHSTGTVPQSFSSGP